MGEGEDRLGVENERPGREDWVEHELHGLLVFVTAAPGSSAIQAKYVHEPSMLSPAPHSCVENRSKTYSNKARSVREWRA